MFLLFAYQRYYPGGASNDFVCKYATMKECVENALKSTFEYTEIYDVYEDNWIIIHEPDNSNKKWIKIEDDEDDWKPLTDDIIQKLLNM